MALVAGAIAAIYRGATSTSNSPKGKMTATGRFFFLLILIAWMGVAWILYGEIDKSVGGGLCVGTSWSSYILFIAGLLLAHYWSMVDRQAAANDGYNESSTVRMRQAGEFEETVYAASGYRY